MRRSTVSVRTGGWSIGEVWPSTCATASTVAVKTLAAWIREGWSTAVTSTHGAKERIGTAAAARTAERARASRRSQAG